MGRSTGMDEQQTLWRALRRARRGVAGAGVMLLLLLLVSGALIARAEEQQRQALASRVDTRQATAVSFIHAYVSKVFETEQALASGIFAGEVTSEEFVDVTAEHGFAASVLLDDEGRLLASQPANPDVVGKDMRPAYAHLRSAAAGTAAVSGVVPSAAAGQPVVGFAVPFQTPAGRRVFSGAYAVQNTPMGIFLRNATPFRSAHVMIVDGAGNVVASNNLPDGGRPVSEVAPRLAGFGGVSGYLGSGPDRQYLTQGPVEGTTWTMVFAVDTAELFAPLDTSSRWIPWLALAAFGATALGALSLTYPYLTQRARLVQSEALRSAILNTAEDAFISMDQDGLISEWNTAAGRLLGWSAVEAIGQPLAELVIPSDQRQGHHDGVHRFLSTGRTSLPQSAVQVQALHRDGTLRDVEFTLSRLQWEHGWRFHAFLRDISERLEHESMLRTIALTDPLTGLANRRAALEGLDQALARSQRHHTPVAVLYIDVDQFKAVNDTYGHAAGDTVLTTLAERLRSTCRTGDTLARLGGDEFLVVCEDLADPDHAQALAERTRSALAQPYLVEGHLLQASASVGLALSDDSSTADGLLERADTAMFRAKASR